LNKALETAKRGRDSAIADRTQQRARQEKGNRRGSEASALGGEAKILLGGRKSSAQVSTGKLDSASFERANGAVRAYQSFSVLFQDFAILTGSRRQRLFNFGSVSAKNRRDRQETQSSTAQKLQRQKQ